MKGFLIFVGIIFAVLGLLFLGVVPMLLGFILTAVSCLIKNPSPPAPPSPPFTPRQGMWHE